MQRYYSLVLSNQSSERINETPFVHLTHTRVFVTPSLELITSSYKHTLRSNVVCTMVTTFIFSVLNSDYPLEIVLKTLKAKFYISNTLVLRNY